MRHSRRLTKRNSGTSWPGKAAIGPGTGPILFIRVLVGESALPTHHNSSLLSFIGHLILSGPRKMFRFVDKLRLGCKADWGAVFWWCYFVSTGTRGALMVLFTSRLWTNDAHFIDFRAVRGVVGSGAGVIFPFLVSPELLAHPGIEIKLLPCGSLCQGGLQGGLVGVRGGRRWLSGCFGWVIQCLHLPLKVQAGAAL